MACKQGSCSTADRKAAQRQSLDQQLNQLVQQLFPDGRSTTRELPTTVQELGDSYRVQFDVPGCVSDDIDVQIADGILSVTVALRKADRGEGITVLHDERPSGTSIRRLRLPKDADVSSIDAELKAGVLTLSLRKVETAVPKKVEIRS
ncbi:MAG: Hsp20/alpha crystallin family protein [Planctomyces sp.]|nr:Hsp20/alpha crystallin family protein [Planctomyces sp.]